MSGRAVEVIGHAGAAGFHPRNSPDSIRKAIDLEVDRIEVDILTALDDVLVLSHDATAILDGSIRPIREIDLDQLRTILDGLLTLEEAFELASDIPLLLDIKGRHFVAPLIEAIANAPPDRELSACGVHGRTLRQLGKACPEVAIGLSRGHSLTKIGSRRLRHLAGWLLSIGQIVTLIGMAKWCGAREVMIQHHICTKPLVKAANLAGLRVITWTVDDPRDIRRVLAAGANGITSNRPDFVIAELEAGGYSRIGSDRLTRDF